MAITFPSSPANNQIFTSGTRSWKYNGIKGIWVSQPNNATMNWSNFDTSIIPSSNVTYDLGSSDKAFRDLYLSGSSINLGGQSITASENGIVLPEGSTVGNISLGAGGATQYANTASLPKTDLTVGQFAFVGNTLFMTNGTGWYSVALVNQTPSLTLSTSSISLGATGNTINFTFTATDPDGPEPTVTLETTANTSQANVTLYTSNNTVTVENLSTEGYSANIVLTATDGIDQTFGTVTLNVSYLSELWDETVLSIGTSSTDGLDNSTFIDRSTNAHTVTPSGSPVQTAFHPYLDNWSVEFDGNATDDKLNFGTIDFGADDFTIEFWANVDYALNESDTIHPIFNNFSWYDGQTNGGINLFVSTYYSSQVIEFDLLTGGGTNRNSAPKVVLDINIESGWNHYAFVRSSGTLYAFMNGELDSQVTITSDTAINYNGSSPYSFGGWYTFQSNSPTTTRYPEGYYSNFRISKGYARYTSNFDVPTENFTADANTYALLNDNRFSDSAITSINGTPKISAFSPFGQGSEYAVGENKGSTYFDGSSDYIQGTEDPTLEFGSGDFTIECWIYRTTTPTSPYHSILGGNGTPFNGWSLYYTNGNEIMLFSSAGSIKTSSGAGITNNQWHHVVATRSSGVSKIFVDGSEVMSQSDSDSYDLTANDWRIGDDANNANGRMAGYIADLKITKGIGVTSVTVPTSPVGNTNSSLYLPMDNAGIFDKTGTNTLTSLGAVTSTTQTKYSSTSIHTPDASSAVKVNNNVVFGTSPFTIEFWIYPTTTGSYNVIADTRTTSNTIGSNMWIWEGGTYNDASGKQRFYVGGTSIYAQSLNAISTNQWTHCAVTRDSNNTLRMFVNGTLESTVSNVTTNLTAPLYTVFSAWNNTYGFTGYFEDFQILNGVAKYTTNFTPPTSTQGRTYQAES